MVDLFVVYEVVVVLDFEVVVVVDVEEGVDIFGYFEFCLSVIDIVVGG